MALDPKLKICATCRHQRHVDIFSIENVFCSYWVEVVHSKTKACEKYKTLINTTL